ncbi:ABC transporter permease [bacterium]|nr:ABC transporter permease [bacterium]
MKRILAVARKEVLHILRDPRSLGVAVFMPLGMLLIYGFAIDMELKELPIAVLDEDHSLESRELLRRVTSSGFIVEAARLDGRGEIEAGFRRNRYRAALVVPRGYAEALAGPDPAQLQVLIDGADGSTAATVDNYLRAMISLVSAQTGTGDAARPPVDVRTRIQFNPELESAHFIVPGLVAVVLMMICALLTSIAITREKETGTLEQILTTPVTPGEVVIGKLLPYVGVGSLDAALVLGVGRFVFGVPMAGSWWVLSAYSLLFVLIALALGLLLSSLAETQRVAMFAALMATFLPTMLLSGFIFAHASMALPLRVLGTIIPATHYLVVVRGIMLKGELWFPRELLIMLVMLIVLVAGATRRFHETLE